MRVAGHCDRHGEEEEASKLVLWQLQHGQTKRGRPKTTYVHTLLEDTGFDTIGELRTVMLNQCEWRGRIQLLSDQTSLYSFPNGNLLLEKNVST